MKTYTVYYHTFPNGKMYFGQTCQDVEKRWGKNGYCYKKQPLMWNAIQKYGWDNIDHRIISIGLDKDEADFQEMFYISAYRTNEIEFGYNLTKGGEGHSVSISEEHKKKISEANKCKKLSDETKKKISEAHKCKISPMKGKHHSEETRIKMSEAAKGRKLSEEHKIKLIESNKCRTSWMKGKHHSEETKKKISESKTGSIYKNKGRTLSYEHRKHISESLKGRTLSEETKEKFKNRPKLKWLTPTGEIKYMDISHKTQHHPEWILITE